MITNHYGTKVLGSTVIQTSVADQEIIPTSATPDKIVLVNFELMNDQLCTIAVNGGTPIYLRALQGIHVDVANSIKIHEAGITFNWIGVVR